MATLPEIYVHRQVQQVVLSIDLDALSDDALIEGTHQMLRIGMAGHIAAGRFFVAMKERFSGRFVEIVEMRFDQSLDVIEAMMAIAREFPDPNTWSSLPSCWTTLERLTRIPQDLREEWRCGGIIHPKLTHREAKELVRRAKLSNVVDNGDDHDGDSGAEQDAEQDVDDQSEPCPTAQPTHEDIDADSDEIERLKAHVEELEAYIAQLEAQAGHDALEIETLKHRNEELKTITGLGDVGWNQRRLLTRAIETAQEAMQNKDDSAERQRLQRDVSAYVIDIVRSAKRDGLDIERFDLAYRPKVEEKPTNSKEISFVPTGTEAQPEQAGA